MSLSWYEERPEPEEAFWGRLAARAPAISPGGRTRLLYELDIDGDKRIPIYAPALEEVLDRFIGSHVELVGKVIDLGSEGFGVELWLAPHALRN